MSKGMRTEDEVRDSAKLVLGFDKTEDGVQQGTGQITTFNQLGFRGCNDKPDGWYLPDDASKPAIILETKSEAEGVSKEKHVKELFKNIDVVAKKYSKTIGILYSGSAIRVFKSKIELSDASKRLEDKNYYIRLCTSQKLDSNYIFEITQKINNSLHFKFGMTDLQDRMIFTACALVAQRYNPQRLWKMIRSRIASWMCSWRSMPLSVCLLRRIRKLSTISSTMSARLPTSSIPITGMVRMSWQSSSMNSTATVARLRRDRCLPLTILHPLCTDSLM